MLIFTSDIVRVICGEDDHMKIVVGKRSVYGMFQFSTHISTPRNLDSA